MRYLLKIVKIILCRFCDHIWNTDQFDRIRVCNRCQRRESSSFSRDEGLWVLKWDYDPIKHDPWCSKKQLR